MHLQNQPQVSWLFSRKNLKKLKPNSKGLAIDQTDDEGWYMLGYSQIESSKFEDAHNSFKKSLSISNNYTTSINNYWIEKYNSGTKDFKTE